MSVVRYKDKDKTMSFGALASYLLNFLYRILFMSFHNGLLLNTTLNFIMPFKELLYKV